MMCRWSEVRVERCRRGCTMRICGSAFGGSTSLGTVLEGALPNLTWLITVLRCTLSYRQLSWGATQARGVSARARGALASALCQSSCRSSTKGSYRMSWHLDRSNSKLNVLAGMS